MKGPGFDITDSPERRDRKLRFLLWKAIEKMGGKFVIDEREWLNVSTDDQFGITQIHDPGKGTVTYEARGARRSRPV